jgi:flagellar hook-length control protein FliK
MKEIVNQIVDKIKVVIKPEATSMEIQLNPENLGKVNLSVISKNGQLTAHFTTESQAAKEALESQMQTLKETLSKSRSRSTSDAT